MSHTKRALSVGMRIAVTLLVLFLIFRSIDVQSVVQTIIGAAPSLLLLALVLQLGSTLVAAYRWKMIMRRLHFGQNFVFYLRSYFKGTFFNQALPTSIGGDALRVLDVARTGHRKRDAFYGVASDRGLGLVGLLVFNWIALQTNPELLPREVFLTINGLVSFGFAGFVALVFLHKVNWLERFPLTVLFVRISQRLAQVLANWRDVLQHLVLALFIHLLGMLVIYYIGNSVGLRFDFLTYMAVVPPVILLTLIPVSLAGWGVREGGMIGLFTLIGADKTLVLSMSILYGMVLLISSLPGFYVYLTGKHHL